MNILIFEEQRRTVLLGNIALLVLQYKNMLIYPYSVTLRNCVKLLVGVVQQCYLLNKLLLCLDVKVKLHLYCPYGLYFLNNIIHSCLKSPCNCQCYCIGASGTARRTRSSLHGAAPSKAPDFRAERKQNIDELLRTLNDLSYPVISELTHQVLQQFTALVLVLVHVHYSAFFRHMLMEISPLLQLLDFCKSSLLLKKPKRFASEVCSNIPTPQAQIYKLPSGFSQNIIAYPNL